MRAIAVGVFVGLALAGTAQGQELRAEIYLLTSEAMDKPIGQVLITTTAAGAKLPPNCRACRRGSTAFTCTRTATAARVQPMKARWPPAWRLADIMTLKAPTPIWGRWARGIWVICHS